MRTWADWTNIHQPYELRYWTTIGLPHLEDDERFQAWWEPIFEFVEPKGKKLDVGCGPRPPFGKDSTAIDPLIDSYKEMTPPEWWEGVYAISSRAEVRQQIGKFDTVMCWNCLDHTIGWKQILANLRFYAGKQGKVALSTDFNRSGQGHPGFEREDFFKELETVGLEVVNYREDFQDRAIALVCK